MQYLIAFAYFSQQLKLVIEPAQQVPNSYMYNVHQCLQTAIWDIPAI